MIERILAKPSESIRIASVSKYVERMALPKMTDERTIKTPVYDTHESIAAREPVKIASRCSTAPPRHGLAIAGPCTDAMRAGPRVMAV